MGKKQTETIAAWVGWLLVVIVAVLMILRLTGVI